MVVLLFACRAAVGKSIRRRATELRVGHSSYALVDGLRRRTIRRCGRSHGRRIVRSRQPMPRQFALHQSALGRQKERHQTQLRGWPAHFVPRKPHAVGGPQFRIGKMRCELFLLENKFVARPAGAMIGTVVVIDINHELAIHGNRVHPPVVEIQPPAKTPRRGVARPIHDRVRPNGGQFYGCLRLPFLIDRPQRLVHVQHLAAGHCAAAGGGNNCQPQRGGLVGKAGIHPMVLVVGNR